MGDLVMREHTLGLMRELCAAASDEGGDPMSRNVAAHQLVGAFLSWLEKAESADRAYAVDGWEARRMAAAERRYMESGRDAGEQLRALVAIAGEQRNWLRRVGLIEG